MAWRTFRLEDKLETSRSSRSVFLTTAAFGISKCINSSSMTWLPASSLYGTAVGGWCSGDDLIAGVLTARRLSRCRGHQRHLPRQLTTRTVSSHAHTSRPPGTASSRRPPSPLCWPQATCIHVHAPSALSLNGALSHACEPVRSLQSALQTLTLHILHLPRAHMGARGTCR
jgi:hypothetical protein